MPPKIKVTIGRSVDEALKAKLGDVLHEAHLERAFESAKTAELVIPSASSVRLYHRLPDPAVTDRRSPRSVGLDEFMAIEPAALERSFFPFFWDDEDDDQREYDVENGVATICIEGPLMQKGGWWWEGYDCILDKFDDALEDPEVEAVVLKISSPGGVCSGLFSTTRSMIALKKDAGKPVYAFADESAYSAAYALACVADEIYLPREGGVGSVGVIGVLEDYTGYNEKLGIKVAVLTSGAHKADGHPDVALKPDVIARYQARITQLGGFFAEHVAVARGMTADAVLALQADVLYGEGAVTAGLANGVKSFEDVMSMAATKATKRIAARAPTTPAYAATTKQTRIANAQKAAAEGAHQESPMTMIALATVALALGLSHEATESDVQAGIGRIKTESAKNAGDADAAKKDLTVVLDAHGAKTAAEAIGKLEAERSSLDELVKAVVGPEKTDGKTATAADALKKLAADRRANEQERAKRLIDEAAAAGKTAGEKAMGIFDKHGMAALEAHLDALVPHTAIVATAPTQKGAPSAAPADTKKDAEFKLSADDEKMLENYGLDREKFIASRKQELADKAKAAELLAS